MTNFEKEGGGVLKGGRKRERESVSVCNAWGDEKREREKQGWLTGNYMQATNVYRNNNSCTHQLP